MGSWGARTRPGSFTGCSSDSIARSSPVHVLSVRSFTADAVVLRALALKTGSELRIGISDSESNRCMRRKASASQAVPRLATRNQRKRPLATDIRDHAPDPRMPGSGGREAGSLVLDHVETPGLKLVVEMAGRRGKGNQEPAPS